jgi:hypothetical protein
VLIGAVTALGDWIIAVPFTWERFESNNGGNLASRPKEKNGHVTSYKRLSFIIRRCLHVPHFFFLTRFTSEPQFAHAPTRILRPLGIPKKSTNIDRMRNNGHSSRASSVFPNP